MNFEILYRSQENSIQKKSKTYQLQQIQMATSFLQVETPCHPNPTQLLKRNSNIFKNTFSQCYYEVESGMIGRDIKDASYLYLKNKISDILIYSCSNFNWNNLKITNYSKDFLSFFLNLSLLQNTFNLIIKRATNKKAQEYFAYFSVILFLAVDRTLANLLSSEMNSAGASYAASSFPQVWKIWT